MGEAKWKKQGLKAAAVESTLAGKVEALKSQAAPLAPIKLNGEDKSPKREVKLDVMPAPVVPWWQRSNERKVIRAWFLARIWFPLTKVFGPVLCAINRHDWKHAPAYDDEGNVVKDRPGNLAQCQRPRCKLFRGQLELLRVSHWIEIDDFMVIANINCPKCSGRGAHRSMLLPSEEGIKRTVLMPCDCLKVHPRYMKTAKVGK